jgi:hypothetical protein
MSTPNTVLGIPYPPPNQQALITHQETSQEIPETSQILAMDTQTSGDKQYLPSQEIELSPRLLPRTSLRPVPAITPSKFHPYLPTSTPPSPIEEFSPTKSKSREPASTLESIEKSTSSGDRTGKGIPETQERLTQASHISDDLGYVDEPLDAPQTDMDVGVQPMSQVAIDEHNQPLGAMEDAFLDYNAGELISQVEPNHDSLSANAGSDSGQSRLLSQLQSQPVNGGPRRAVRFTDLLYTLAVLTLHRPQASRGRRHLRILARTVCLPNNLPLSLIPPQELP